MRLQTWQQTQFLTPNRYLEKKSGDFWSIDNFIPAIDAQSLERMPSWTGHIDFVANFVEPYGAFYDTDNDDFCFVGTSEATAPFHTIGVMTIAQSNLATGGLYSIGTGATGAMTHLDGNHKQNVYYIVDDFWCICWDGYAYKANNYTGAAPSVIFNTNDCHTLLPVRDTFYLIDVYDDIYTWNPDTSAFDIYLETRLDLNIYHAIHYRENIVMFARPDDGSLIIYQVDDRPPAEIRQLLRVPSESATYIPDDANAEWATPWAIHDDRLFFTPGIYWSDDSDAEIAPIWTFDGNSIALIDHVAPPIVPNAWGLLNWRSRLLLYFINNSAQHIYLYHGGRFTQILEGSYTTENHCDLYSLAGELWLPIVDVATEGWMRLDDFRDATFTSSWLDMERPTHQKHLLSLSAVVSDAIADFKVKIEYRTESGSWTTAVTTNGARHIIAENIGADFYLLQVRITFDDDTATGNQDVSLQSVAATYSYGR